MPVAVITGAGRGIGAATARRLHADGWNLGLIDVCCNDPDLPYDLSTADDLDAVADECGGALTFAADVRELDRLQAAVVETETRFGRIDAAVAGAGVVAGGAALWDLPASVWSTVLDVNLGGVQNLAVATVPSLLHHTNGNGRFVAVSSTAGQTGMPGLAAYNAAKAGVDGLIRGLAADLAGSGVTANAVAPGSTATPILDASAALYDLADAKEFASHHLLGRLLRPDEIAEAIAWLCSEASSAVTGAIFPIDGGAK